MVWSTIFANLSAGNQPLSLFDAMFSQIAGLSAIPATAAGTNTIALTGLSNAPTYTAYVRYTMFRFRAAGTSSGAVTINYGGIGALNAYKIDGSTQIGANDIINGQEYLAVYDSALNAGAGGFFVEQASIPLAPTVNTIYPGGRLTLRSGEPCMQTSGSVTGATAHFYTPYINQHCPVNVNGVMTMLNLGGELTQAASDTTKSPAAVANNSVYDIFVWNDAGVLRATRGPAWTNDTTRGYSLARVQGILTNNSNITNGPLANFGTWVGTLRSNGSATFDFIFGTAASGGGLSSLYCWNAYNRVPTATRVTDNGGAYSYTTATVRAAGSSSNNRINYVVGAIEDAIVLSYTQRITTVAVATANGGIGIGNDSSSVLAIGVSATINAPTANAFTGTAVQNYDTNPPGIGVHFFQGCELGDGANANTFNAGGASAILNGYFML